MRSRIKFSAWNYRKTRSTTLRWRSFRLISSHPNATHINGTGCRICGAEEIIKWNGILWSGRSTRTIQIRSKFQLCFNSNNIFISLLRMSVCACAPTVVSLLLQYLQNIQQQQQQWKQSTSLRHYSLTSLISVLEFEMILCAAHWHE